MTSAAKEPARVGRFPESALKTDIAVVGAGVAGSRLACLLAGHGFKVMLFDPKPAWEKPCGGGLTDKLVTEFGDVVDDLPDVRKNFRLEVVFSRRRRAGVTMNVPLVTVSRRLLGESLLNKAVDAGAGFRKEKVLSIRREGEGTALVTPAGAYRANLVVGADGANSLVRRTFSRPFPKEDIWLTHGVLLPVVVNLPIIIQFFYGSEGYAWIFPRRGETSVGIIGRRSDGLNRKQQVERLRSFALREFARARLPLPELERPYGWILPSLEPRAFAGNAVAGPGWALVGDASGAVDPLTGEGIYYAVKTAHLLAEALIQGSLESYAPAWQAMAATSIAKVGKKRELFYRPATLRALGLLLDYSPSVRALAGNIICGSQRYDTLKSRVKAELPTYIREAMLNLMTLRKGEKRGN
jgi:flavin-dependent dehydrogenase